MLTLETSLVRWPLLTPFTISRETMFDVGTVQVRISDPDGHVGVAEAVGVDHIGETPESVLAQIDAVWGKVCGAVDRAALQELLPPGGARNALDCALWDLEAKRSGLPCWKAAGLAALEPRETAFTFGLMNEADLRKTAMDRGDFALLKVKTNREHGLDPVRIVHEVAPRARLIVDPNEDWEESDLVRYAPLLATLGVALLEQPVRHDADEVLHGLSLPVPVAADEAFIDSRSIPALIGKYQALNIKLDKTGGLTEALRCVTLGRASGFSLMVGCMVGSSLAMAPATLVAQDCSFVDLDGPLLQAADCPHPIAFEGGRIGVPSAALWG